MNYNEKRRTSGYCSSCGKSIMPKFNYCSKCSERIVKYNQLKKLKNTKKSWVVLNRKKLHYKPIYHVRWKMELYNVVINMGTDAAANEIGVSNRTVLNWLYDEKCLPTKKYSNLVAFMEKQGYLNWEIDVLQK